MSDNNLTLSPQVFSDLQTSEAGLINEIEAAESHAALEGVINNINRLIKVEESFSYKQILKRCRQRAYDRKRKLPPLVESSQELSKGAVNELKELKKTMGELKDHFSTQRSIQNKIVSLEELRAEQEELRQGLDDLQCRIDVRDELTIRLEELENQVSKYQSTTSVTTELHTIREEHNFLSMTFGQIKRLNGARFIECFPLAIVLMGLTAICTYFVVDQTTPLYTAFNFKDPSQMAWGAAGMAICFSGIYGAKKGYGLGFMCFLIAAYEVLFVLSGTASHEEKINSQQVQAHPKVVLKSEELTRLKSDYEEKKTLYEDPNGRNFKNAWYKRTHLEPAWETYKKAVSSLIDLKSTIKTNEFDKKDHLWLKLLYRLCAVILSMVLSGLTIGKLQESFAYT